MSSEDDGIIIASKNLKKKEAACHKLRTWIQKVTTGDGRSIKGALLGCYLKRVYTAKELKGQPVANTSKTYQWIFMMFVFFSKWN